MKVLVLLSRVPWPLEKGDKLRAYNQLQWIAKQHEVILVCLSDSKIDPEARKNLAPYCSEIHFIRLSRIRIMWNLLLSLFNDKPFQVNYFYQKGAQKKVDRIIERTMPKHLYVQLIRTAEYAKKYHVITSTLDYMDAFSMGAKRRIDKAFPGFRFLITSEAKRLKRYENLVFNQFTNKTIISENDRELIEHPDHNEIEIVPNGVDFSRFQSDPSVEKSFDVVFTGNMSYPPNVKAAKFLAEEIYPILSSQLPESKWMIAGANPHPSVKRLASENIHVTGWMDKITDAYNQARVFVAPMEIGTGMQNKILEAMSMGLPCLTSELAASAIGGTHMENILIANNPQEYSDWIQKLLSDSELYDGIARNGKDFVMKNFNWEANSEPLLTLINSSN